MCLDADCRHSAISRKPSRITEVFLIHMGVPVWARVRAGCGLLPQQELPAEVCVSVPGKIWEAARFDLKAL
jgi:hypothetical protein